MGPISGTVGVLVNNMVAHRLHAIAFPLIFSQPVRGFALRQVCAANCERRWAQVREVAQEAVARARRGDGPTLIEAETYRFRGHSLADPDELRLKEEKEHYQARLCWGDS